jgi:predicted nucleic acid-binding protein
VIRAAQTVNAVVCAEHGRAEVVAAAHRKLRELVATQDQFSGLVRQFRADCAGGGIRWLPLTESIFKRAEAAFLAAPADAYLRAANALHLACAAKHGFAEIHSNDRHLLSAAPLFSVRGVNLITPCAKALRLRVLPTAPLPACRGDRVPNQQDQQVLEAAMKVKYDQEVDVLTIEFSKAPGGGE